MKFEESFCTNKCKTFTIDEIAYIHNMNLKVFANEYKDYLVCPECHKANLSYNNATTPYFRAYPKAIHKEGCSLIQEEMTEKQAIKFIGDKKNNASIIRQMESILAILILDEPEPYPLPKPKCHLRITPNNTESKSNLLYNSTRFPRKRIDIAFRPEDYDCYKFFYGKVILQWEKDNTKGRYKMLLFHPKTKKMICKILVSNTVYSYIDNKYKFPYKYICNIVFLATFIENKEHAYQTTSLRFGHYLSLIKKL